VPDALSGDWVQVYTIAIETNLVCPSTVYRVNSLFKIAEAAEAEVNPVLKLVITFG